jgi:hypothetical protein
MKGDHTDLTFLEHLVPELPIRLFSPQHAAREIQKKDNQPDRAWFGLPCGQGITNMLQWKVQKEHSTWEKQCANSKDRYGYSNSHDPTVANHWSTQAIKSI